MSADTDTDRCLYYEYDLQFDLEGKCMMPPTIAAPNASGRSESLVNTQVWRSIAGSRLREVATRLGQDKIGTRVNVMCEQGVDHCQHGYKSNVVPTVLKVVGVRVRCGFNRLTGASGNALNGQETFNLKQLPADVPCEGSGTLRPSQRSESVQ